MLIVDEWSDRLPRARDYRWWRPRLVCCGRKRFFPGADLRPRHHQRPGDRRNRCSRATRRHWHCVGNIARVGALSPAQARARLDAGGLIVSPGFIDVHTHADNLASSPLAPNFVRMGVTTIVAGNCGSSALAVGEALDRILASTPGAELRDARRAQHRAQRRHGRGRARPDAR